MRRLLCLVLTTSLAWPAVMSFGARHPVSAAVACGGDGTMYVSPGLAYSALVGALGSFKEHDIDILIGKINWAHGFSFVFNAGACAYSIVPPGLSWATASGVLKGYCDHSSGFGTLNGWPFAYVSVGTSVVFTGHLVGVGSINPVPLFTASCLHAQGPSTVPNPFRLEFGGATQFEVVMAAIGFDCPDALPAAETLFRPFFQQVVLPTQTLGAHVDYGVHLYTMPQCTDPDIS